MQEEVIIEAREYPGCGCVFKGIMTLGLYFFWWQAKRLIVTNRRVIWRSGVFGAFERSIPLGKVTDIQVKTLFGQNRVGEVRIESAGGPGTEIVAVDIERPHEIRDAILSQTS